VPACCCHPRPLQNNRSTDIERLCLVLLFLQQPWVQELIASLKDSKLVFSADGYATGHHLSTGLSQDHLVGHVTCSSISSSRCMSWQLGLL
jgi:hypothetical protein